MGVHNQGWQLVRSVQAVDNPVLAAATMDGKPSFAININSTQVRNIELILAATGIDAGSVVVRIWGGRGAGGPARLISTITWTLGLMLCNKDPQTQLVTDLTRFADTAVLTAGTYWPVPIAVCSSAGDKLCLVSFDCLDIDWIAAEITTLTSVTKANVYLGYFD